MGNAAFNKKSPVQSARLTKESDYISCQFCNKSFVTNHLITHSELCDKRPKDVNNICEHCGINFQQEQALYAKHISICKQNPDNIQMSCKFCKDRYTKLTVDKHLTECEWNPSNIQIVCEFCEAKIPFRDHKEHIDNCKAHPDLVTKIECEFCGKGSNLREHTEHLKICRANPDNIKIKCEYCGKKFNGNYYSEHVDQCSQQVHQEMNNECIICLMDIKVNDHTIFLDCIHKFHKKCITEWSKKQTVCPVCQNEFDVKLIEEEATKGQ